VSASGPVIDPTVGSAAMCPSFADPALLAPAPGDGSAGALHPRATAVVALLIMSL